MNSQNLEAREAWFDFACARLNHLSKENRQTLKYHLFHLKVNDDFVINSKSQLEDLVSYMNKNHI